MKEPHPKTSVTRSGSKSTRRAIDTLGLVAFHLGFLAVVAYTSHQLREPMLLVALLVVAMDVTYFFSPPKQRTVLDPIPGPEPVANGPRLRDYWLEFLVLLGPPSALMIWFQYRIWGHQTLTQGELIAVVAAMPVAVWAVTRIIKYRLTHQLKDTKNAFIKFIAGTMLVTWIGATFLWVLLVMGLVFTVL